MARKHAMKVFISSSGDRSKVVAAALADWLGKVIQGVRPRMSSHSIASGSRWAAELGAELQTSDYGVFCSTPENLSAPWLLFEAGVIAKA